jgi:hypothetical protein
MAASRRLGAFNKHVRKGAERSQLASIRDNAGYVPAATINNAKQIGVAAGSIAGMGSQILGSVSGFFGVLTGALYVADGASVVAQQNGRMKELKAAKGTASALPPSADVLHALSKPFDANIDRLHRQAERDRGFAISRIVKGLMESVIGAVGSGFAIAAIVGVGVVTAGTAIAIAGAALSVCFIASCALKAGYAWKSEHTSKQRQRFAEQVAATTDRKELEQIFESAYVTGVDRRERNMRIVHTRDRQTGTQTRQVRLKKMDIISNEYLALEVLAGFILDQSLDQSRTKPVGSPGTATLQVDGTDFGDGASGAAPMTSMVRQPIGVEAMSELEFTQIINALRIRKQAAEAAWKVQSSNDKLDERQFFLDQEKSDLWFIKKSIAPSLGLKLRTAAGGKQEDVPAVVFWDAFETCYGGAKVAAETAESKAGKRPPMKSALGSQPKDSQDSQDVVIFQKIADELFTRISRSEFLAAAVRVKDRQDQLDKLDEDQWKTYLVMKRFVKWINEGCVPA